MFVRPRKRRRGERERGTEGKEGLLVCSLWALERRQFYPSLGAAPSRSVGPYCMVWRQEVLKFSLLVPHLGSFVAR